jgi:deferrochelatase/peroxidase EfeB
MNKIPFTIALHGKTFIGYLQTTDVHDPPKSFFVFIDTYIIGDLIFNKKWIFSQGGRYKFLKQMNTGERNYFAEYLGNIAELGYE